MTVTGEETPVRRYKTKPVAARFWSRVEKTDTCWLFTGALNADGYAYFYANRKLHRAHRFAYEFLVGPIPRGLTIDHLCRVRHCVNPAHLEAVTNRENVLRGDTLPARNAAKTHCFRGHEFTPENTRIRSDGSRNCLACVPFKTKSDYQLKKARAALRDGKEQNQ